jgi:membrane-bound lytic murein transglycosylase A
MRLPWGLFLLALGLALASCAVPRGLVPVEKPQELVFHDDGTDAGLDQAIDQSLAYYRRVPGTTRYPFAGETYAPAELAASLELFRALRRSAPDPRTLGALLARNFRVYESVAEEGDNLFTGYFEPIIPGSETPTAELSMPLYARPANMVEVRLDQFGSDLPPRTLVGRVENGQLVPYYTREQIQTGNALEGKATPLAYVNPVDLFFLQIQGSGAVRFPDGREVKVGYVASNGHPYRSIGAELLRRNELSREEISLQSIRRYLAEHPEEEQALLNTNPSYIFFQVQPQGPLGVLNVPLTPGRSLALDRRLFPPGVLAYVVTEVPVPFEPGVTRPFSRFMLVQDTGGAIRGQGRGDLFWGQGPDAEWIAGHEKMPGRLFLLLAKKEQLAAGVPAPSGPPSAGTP